MNILLVEDDAGIARFILRGLAARGYEVTVERDGAAAEARLHGSPFAAMILDRALPDCDGLDLCRRLRRTSNPLPVILLTARGTLQDRLDGFAGGADDYLPKPFAFEELVARLAAVIRRAAAPPVVRGSLALEPHDRTARIGGRPLPLRPREFDLLLALARAGDRVVSREALLGQVWGAEAEISDNALDVYVGYLRRRLAGTGGIAIETHRGLGFRLTTLSEA